MVTPGNQKKKSSNDELCIENAVSTLNSSLWVMQHKLYSNASIREYAFQTIPMGISSSSYLARVGFILSY